MTSCCKPVVTDGAAYPNKGKVVSTTMNKSTGHIDTPDTPEAYK